MFAGGRSFPKETVLKAKIPNLMFGIFAFMAIVSSFYMPNVATSSARLLVPPPPYLKHMVAGYDEVVADLMWIRAIQDLDYCDQPQGDQLCHSNSWLYKMIDTITELAPSFRTPYAAGALSLTVMVSDIEGATKIFDKAIKKFPSDWPIHYQAAYHYLYEVQDKKKAAELLIKAGENGGPPFVFALAGRLYSDLGYMDLAENLLQQMIQEKQDEQFIERLRKKIAEIKSKGNSKSSSQ